MTSGDGWHDPRIDGLLPDAYIQMGHSAEYVARITGVTRAEQDEFALRSQQRAARSQDSGFFAREIVPVQLPDGTMCEADDSLRPGTTACPAPDTPGTTDEWSVAHDGFHDALGAACGSARRARRPPASQSAATNLMAGYS